MSEDLSRLDTTDVLRRFVDGRDKDDALAEYFARYRGKYVRAANRLIHKLGVSPASFDGEGAVNMAFLELCQMRDRGRLEVVEHSEAVLKLMSMIVERLINDEKKRSNARKRGGTGEMPRTDRARGKEPDPQRADPWPAAGYHRIEMSLDKLASGEPLVVDMVLSKMEVENFLEKLPDPALRTIFKMRHQGYSTKEIASRLGVVERTVQRKLVRIQLLYSDLNPGEAAKHKRGDDRS